MRFLINTELLPEQWHWTPENPLTGTTKFYVRVAEELVKKGHEVTVSYDGIDRLLHGVWYFGRGKRHVCDVQLDCNVQNPLPEGPAPRRLQWTSFFNRPDVCIGEGYERLFLVSSYVHSTLAHAVKAPVTVLELGCDLETVSEPKLAEREKVCCYTSSPDRGGTFLAQAWPQIEAETGYRLEMSPYGTSFSAEDLRALYLRSRFWLYPALGLDSIISTLEAQACGCIPFYVPHMGLPETVRYGITTDHHRFVPDLIRALKTPLQDFPEDWEDVRYEALTARPIPSWSDVADRILECL